MPGIADTFTTLAAQDGGNAVECRVVARPVCRLFPQTACEAAVSELLAKNTGRLREDYIASFS